MKYLFFVFILLLSSIEGKAQAYEMIDSVRIRGQIFSAMVQDGDTLILAQLDDVSLTSLRDFKSRDEYLRYLKYKRYAAVVYPYAKDAIGILKKVEERTQDMKRSKRKKYIKHTYKQLENNFKKQLKKLSKTQGKILVKMIEKEMDDSFYNIIKDKRGRFTAAYWHQFGKMFGYNLKEGYIEGEDIIMDAVLRDFDISFDKDSSNKILSK